MTDIQAIETEYDGYRFRSRQEARWAVFFNFLDVEYRYEPEGFELPNGERYLPDFYLPNIGFRSVDKRGIWVEVKGYVADENTRESEVFTTVKKFVEAINEPLMLLVGEINNHHDDWNIYEIKPHERVGSAVDAPMVWVKCSECNKIKIEFPESNYMKCENCNGKMRGYGINNIDPDIANAVEQANKARFEHGEKPDA